MDLASAVQSCGLLLQGTKQLLVESRLAGERVRGTKCERGVAAMAGEKVGQKGRSPSGRKCERVVAAMAGNLSYD
jgi:hypothetical protein